MNLLSYSRRVRKQAEGGHARTVGNQRCPVETDRIHLATETTYRWSRSPVARHTSGAKRNLWILGTCAQWRELPNKYPPYQTGHRRFQQWVREGRLEGILHLLAEELHARGKLQLDEAFIDASFRGEKKGVWRLDPPSAARGRKSSLSPMITLFPSPLVLKALHRTKASSSKESSGKASSTPFRTIDR
jgi:transposase